VIAADTRIAIHTITRARLLLELGRIDEASQGLIVARQRGGLAAAIDAVQADVDWAMARYPQAAEAIRRLAKEAPSVATLTRRGRLEHAMGDPIEGDRAFDGAEDHAAGDALALAEVYAWRGAAKLDAGKPEEARPWFDAALARVPSHTRAIRGLAEALDRFGDRKGAIAKLEAVGQAKDHALLALLAHLSPAARPKAKARLTELGARTPEAVLAPAAAFALDTGEPKRAVELAARAVRTSPSAANHVLLARAQLEAGDAQAARVAIETALRAPLSSARTDWTAARVYARLGEAGKADELAARARRRDSRIESTEPPLKK
jgi:tetratricopeptide (TPR) repeat protein